MVGEWGQTHPQHQGWHLGPSWRPLWGLMLGCFKLFVEITLVGEASPHKGPLLEQQLPRPGRGGWEPPHFAAASTYFEQEEQKCQSSMLPVRCPGSPHTPLFRVMLLRDGAIVWEGGGSLCPTGWREQGRPGGPAIPPEGPQ